jgi:putative heme iron utilization protein
VTATTFPPDVVAAICRHMNDDHAADSLLICRTLAARPDATHAEAVGVDSEGMRFRVTADGRPEELTVPFATPAPERAQVRVAVVELYERACAAADLEPRGH